MLFVAVMMRAGANRPAGGLGRRIASCRPVVAEAEIHGDTFIRHRVLAVEAALVAPLLFIERQRVLIDFDRFRVSEEVVHAVYHIVAGVRWSLKPSSSVAPNLMLCVPVTYDAVKRTSLRPVRAIGAVSVPGAP